MLALLSTDLGKSCEGSMVAQFVDDLHLPLSKVRLESYRSDGDSDLRMVANYFWDMELSGAILPALHAVELALRNSIHHALSDVYGTERWFYTPGVLEPGQLRELAGALGNLAQKKAEPTAGRIVAELMFGFWVSLMTSRYEVRLWQPNRFELMKVVFPNAVGLSRKQIHHRFNDIRIYLRNRVSHHEAIWDRPNLGRDYTDVLDAIGWVSPTLRTSVEEFSQFPTVHDHGNGYRRIEERITRHLAEH